MAYVLIVIVSLWVLSCWIELLEFRDEVEELRRELDRARSVAEQADRRSQETEQDLEGLVVRRKRPR